MSYSFSVTGHDKESALKSVEQAMAEVVAGQPIHARDKDVVAANAAGAVGLLADDATQDVGVSVCGSLGWNPGEPGKEELTTVSVAVTAWLVRRDAA